MNSVKHFERSNGLDTALYKNIPTFIGIQLYACARCTTLCVCVSQNTESTETVQVIGGDNLADLKGKVSESQDRSYADNSVFFQTASVRTLLFDMVVREKQHFKHEK